ncbi:Retrovirus-related Pol polyprotein from transposon RE1 [Vitis vinifera]|uniref:Retrovirus-related Pol polyprotein from transposon RE1 n=1 Tax=Vitis vinifera TaxID=29760 RepID=A0A438D8S9_VITVI|nr:Retrovirus-related Pol polyprotein from transposon RE1 [Vitis vinifera]
MPCPRNLMPCLAMVLLVPPYPSQNLVNCKWVFHIKHKLDGSIERYKAQLVTKGFHQHPSIDYHDTFGLVVKPTTIRVILSLVLSNEWSLQQLDVNNVFLHGHLFEDVYMVQPLGFIDQNLPNHVCCLCKALYGLEQALWAWYTGLWLFLVAASNYLGFINKFVSQLATRFSIKDHGSLSFFLRVEVIPSEDGLFLSQ